MSANTPFSIRRATLTDAAALAALAERTFRETFARDNSPQNMDGHCLKSFGAEIQLAELADPLGVSLLAEADGDLAGFAQLKLRSATPCVTAKSACELKRLYVVRPWHARGVAQELMRAVLAAAAAAKSDRIWLGVWERNPRAMAFYRKFGFGVVGEHRFDLGTEPQRDLIMAAPVSAAPPSG